MNNLGKKKANTIWSHLHVESKKINNDNNNINPNSPKEIQICSYQTVGAGGMVENWEEGIKRYKLILIRAISTRYVIYNNDEYT